MLDSLLKDVDGLLKDKAFLSLEDVAHLLNCEEKVIYNWMKRPDPSRRPPKLTVGKSVRFPKTEFCKWLTTELSGDEGGAR